MELGRKEKDKFEKGSDRLNLGFNPRLSYRPPTSGSDWNPSLMGPPRELLMRLRRPISGDVSGEALGLLRPVATDTTEEDWTG